MMYVSVHGFELGCPLPFPCSRYTEHEVVVVDPDRPWVTHRWVVYWCMQCSCGWWVLKGLELQGNVSLCLVSLGAVSELHTCSGPMVGSGWCAVTVQTS